MDMQRQADQDANDQLFVQFYMGSLQNETKSKEAGHPVFDMYPFIKVVVPGDRNTNIDTRVRDKHKAQFPKLWAMFEQSQKGSEIKEGLPIREWAAVTRAQADELAYFHVHTVEQLASVADVHASKIMGFNELRRKAEAFLLQAKDTAAATKLAADNEALQMQIDAMKEQLEKQSTAFDAAMAQLREYQSASVEQHGKGSRTGSR